MLMERRTARARKMREENCAARFRRTKVFPRRGKGRYALRMSSPADSPENFTLEQVIVLLSITIVVVAVTIFSIDPMMRLRAARNMQRWAEANAIAGALRAYRDGHGGAFPPDIDRVSSSVQLVGRGGKDCSLTVCKGERIAWANCFVPHLREEMQDYIQPFPLDPRDGLPKDTRYYVNIAPKGAIIVGACDEEPEDIEGKGLPPRIQVAW